MKAVGSLALAAAAVISLPAAASVVTLDFEGLGNNALIQNFYNGGTDSLGNSGVNYGITFTGAATAIVDSGQANYANEPTPPTIMTFTQGTSAIMNDAAGFTDGFSFWYTSNFRTTVTIYDALNGTGNALGSFDITPNASTGCDSPDYCNWTAVGEAFQGIGMSVVFSSSTTLAAGFDNVTFGSVTPGTGGTQPVPEPGSLALVGLALAALGWSARRRA